eukprot:GHVS01083693.1.p1 GENE.GHVS01083693.1~~GHVS01083693.1.p1  ORF type:complete len:855 (+),score=43.01 GHVS01083693.1:123-2687(+)
MNSLRPAPYSPELFDQTFDTPKAFRDASWRPSPTTPLKHQEPGLIWNVAIAEVFRAVFDNFHLPSNPYSRILESHNAKVFGATPQWTPPPPPPFVTGELQQPQSRRELSFVMDFEQTSLTRYLGFPSRASANEKFSLHILSERSRVKATAGSETDTQLDGEFEVEFLQVTQMARLIEGDAISLLKQNMKKFLLRATESFLTPVQVEFRLRFGLTENVLKSYRCALSRTILLDGRLYVSQNLVGFYSQFNDTALFGGDTTVLLSLREVVDIRKKVIGVFFDNSIEIELEDGTIYFFATFANRDKVYQLITDLCDAQKKMNEAGTAPSCDIDGAVRGVPEASMDASDSAQGQSSPAIAPKRASVLTKLQATAPAPYETELFDEIFDTPVAFQDSSWRPSPTTPLKHQEAGLIWNVAIAEVFRAVFDNFQLPSNPYSRILEAHNAEVFGATPQWAPSPPPPFGTGELQQRQSCRELSFEMDLKQTALTRFLRFPSRRSASEKFSLHILSERCFVVESWLQLSGMPLSDCFCTRSRFKATALSETDTQLDGEFEVEFSKNTVMAGKIESEAMSHLKENMKKFFQWATETLRSLTVPAISCDVDGIVRGVPEASMDASDSAQSRDSFDRSTSRYSFVRKTTSDVPSYDKPMQDEFRLRFGLTENVLKSYSCALSRTILLQGRLYVSQNLVGFFSMFNDTTLFGQNTTVLFYLSHVVDIRKKIIAYYFDNSIEIELADGTIYLFATFMNRDEVYQIITNLWDIHKKMARGALTYRHPTKMSWISRCSNFLDTPLHHLISLITNSTSGLGFESVSNYTCYFVICFFILIGYQWQYQWHQPLVNSLRERIGVLESLLDGLDG